MDFLSFGLRFSLSSIQQKKGSTRIEFKRIQMHRRPFCTPKPTLSNGNRDLAKFAPRIPPHAAIRSRDIFLAGNPAVISARLKSRRGFNQESRRDFVSQREPRREFFCQQDLGRIPVGVIFLFQNPGKSLLSSGFQWESRRDFFPRREPRQDFFF